QVHPECRRGPRAAGTIRVVAARGAVYPRGSIAVQFESHQGGRDPGIFTESAGRANQWRTFPVCVYVSVRFAGSGTAFKSMKKRLTVILLLLLVICAGAPTNARAGNQSSGVAEVNQLIDRYFDFYFRNHPTAATAVGFHQFDGKLEDFSRQALTSELAGLKDFQARFDSVVDSDMPADARLDRELVRSAIKARLLELESIQMWRKDPDLYTSSVSYSVFLVMKRNFAPAEERLRAVIARERQIPGVFDAARRNLENPPRIYTEVALQQLPDVAGFFEKDVPAAFATVKDQKLLADFKVSNAGAV